MALHRWPLGAKKTKIYNSSKSQCQYHLFVYWTVCSSGWNLSIHFWFECHAIILLLTFGFCIDFGKQQNWSYCFLAMRLFLCIAAFRNALFDCLQQVDVVSYREWLLAEQQIWGRTGGCSDLKISRNYKHLNFFLLENQFVHTKTF